MLGLNVARNRPATVVSADGIIYLWPGGDGCPPPYFDGEYYDLADWPGGSWTTITGDNIPQPHIRAGHTCTSDLLWTEGGGPFPGHDANQFWDGVGVCYWPVATPDVPSMWEDPITGTGPALTDFVEIGFTSWYTTTTETIHLPLGTYTATLKVNNNDQVAGPIDVPAIMHIVEQAEPPTATPYPLGRLEKERRIE